MAAALASAAPPALASKGPGGAVCRLGPAQLSRLRAALDHGPADWGWAEDQRWTLERVTTLIGRLFHVRYTLRGTSYLLHRIGYTPQVPVDRAAERNEEAIAHLAGRDLGEASRLAAATGAYLCFEDEAGQSCARRRPAPGPAAATPPWPWCPGRGPGGCPQRAWCAAPSLMPAAGSSTGSACTASRKGERRSLSEADYAGLVTAAHQQLHAPLILCWDNLNTHISATMRGFTGAHPNWLTVVQLPAYAPDLNPVEGAWANMKSSLGNLGSCSTPDQLAAIIKNRLKRIQYRPALIDGFLAQTGLSLEPQPP